MEPLKLFVFGVDGASAAILDDLIARDMLPTFAALRARSSAGVLQSTFPPHTAPGWASMFTGVEPGEHGIYQFWSTQPQNYVARGMNVADFGREPIWRALERHGFRVGVNNVPMTHPPVALRDGYMISWPLAKTLRYTAPPELMTELAAAGLHYHSDIVTMFRGQADYREQATRFVEGRARTCLYLQETRPVDAMLVVFTELDRVSHYYWGEEERPGEDVEDIYVKIDRALETLLAMTDESTLIVIASDHGFVHEALERHGLLATSYLPTAAAAPAEPVAKDDTAQSAWFESSALFRRSVDWARTRVYMPTPGCFGLNVNLAGRERHGIVAAGDLPQLEREIAAMLEGIVDEAGRPWFTLVPRDEVYAGARLADAPDYLLVPRDLSVMPAPNLAGELWSKPSQPGVHRADGVLWVTGSTFPAGGRLHARIEDVHAVILAHLGLPVPDALDGHWLVEPAREVTRERAVVAGGGERMTPLETAYMDGQLQQIGYF
jgi:predicted AlkP superfamily phosphohydrolase/phosphomutase